VILEARQVTHYYGDVRALDDVTLGVEPGQLVSIIGPNGAGKSTLINVLTGLLEPSTGAVRFKGRDIAGAGPVRAARLGLARSFQFVQIFPELTVLETLQAAMVSRLGRGRRILRSLRADAEVRRDAEHVADLFGLRDQLHAPSRTLPQGGKKILDVAAAFALRPEAILLDEPTSGVSTRDKTLVMQMLAHASRGIGVQASSGEPTRTSSSDTDGSCAQEGGSSTRRRAGCARTGPCWPPWWAGPRRPRRRPQRPDPVLRLDAVNVFIQSSHILRDVSLTVEPGALVCLVGRNGAGKTTTLRTVMGYLRPTAGRIELGGETISGLPTHAIARRGVGYAPEEGGIFGDLTVAENVEIATWTRPGGRPASERIALAYDVFPRLRGYAARGGLHLSGGERKMLAIARALALDPELLLLDEPFEGLSPAIVGQIAASIAAIRARVAPS
jgi:ABC-type branched-subunit amino acid transport system ATPase component